MGLARSGRCLFHDQSCSQLRTHNVEATAPNCWVIAAITCPRKSSNSRTEASGSETSPKRGLPAAPDISGDVRTETGQPLAPR
jgi:hypothetical protein